MNTKAMAGLVLVLVAGPAVGQTVYKCPKPDGTTMIQQMPCSLQGGGETMTVNPPKTSGDESGEATARMKAYSESLNKEWEKQNETRQSNQSPESHFDRIRQEELAKDCYAMEKRINWIKKKEKEGAHLERDSVADNDSKKAIEEYKSRCGSWNH